MAHSGERYRSGELARVAGVSPDTLRFYEQNGLLARPPRTASGYRIYPAESLKRVRLIRGALSLGFSIGELKKLLAERDSGGSPCLFARKLAEEKLAAVELQLAELRSFRTILRKAIGAWDKRIATSPANARLHLLEAFVEANPDSVERKSPLMPLGLRSSKIRRTQP